MTRTSEVHNGKDIIDSRDVIARIAELESDRDTAMETATEHKARIAELEAMDAHTLDEADEKVQLESAIWTAEDGTEYAESGDWDEETEREWKALKSLADDAEGYAADWHYGEALIRDSYFEDYARETAEDCDLIGRGKTDSWPLTCIDWERAADELKQDYTRVEFDGVDYWIR